MVYRAVVLDRHLDERDGPRQLLERDAASGRPCLVVVEHALLLVQHSGLRGEGSGFRAQGSRFGVEGLGFRV